MALGGRRQRWASSSYGALPSFALPFPACSLHFRSRQNSIAAYSFSGPPLYSQILMCLSQHHLHQFTSTSLHLSMWWGCFPSPSNNHLHLLDWPQPQTDSQLRRHHRPRWGRFSMATTLRTAAAATALLPVTQM